MAYTEEKAVGHISASKESTNVENALEEDSLYAYNPDNVDVAIRHYTYHLYHLLRREKKGQLIIPTSQRNIVWTSVQQSKFIESILLKFPMPPFYFNQTIEGKLIVVDGFQRMSALGKFVGNTFALEGLTTLPKLNGKYFKDLRDIQKVTIEDTAFQVNIIMPSVPLAAVYDIFSRINIGGTQLKRQEIRNAIFHQQAAEFLKKLTNANHFRLAIDGKITSTNLQDQAFVLRYLAFQIFDYKDYHGNMSDFLESAMRRLDAMSSDELMHLEKGFNKAMKLIDDFFGKKKFNLPTSINNQQTNIALWESVAHFFTISEKTLLEKNKAQIIDNYQQLLNDEQYLAAVKTATGTKKSVQTRFEQAKQILGKL